METCLCFVDGPYQRDSSFHHPQLSDGVSYQGDFCLLLTQCLAHELMAQMNCYLRSSFSLLWSVLYCPFSFGHFAWPNCVLLHPSSLDYQFVSTEISALAIEAKRAHDLSTLVPFQTWKMRHLFFALLQNNSSMMRSYLRWAVMPLVDYSSHDWYWLVISLDLAHHSQETLEL